MELEYKLRQSDLHQEQIRLQQAQLARQLEEQQQQRLQALQAMRAWEDEQDRLRREHQQVASEQDRQQLAELQLQQLQQQREQFMMLQASDQSCAALERNDDAALLSILGDGGGEKRQGLGGGRGKRSSGTGTLLCRPGHASRPRRAASACGARLVRLEVHRKEDLWRISRALGTSDLVLQRDLEVEGKTLARGLRLLRQGALTSCTGASAKAALESMEPWVRLCFERPLEPTPKSGLEHLLTLSGNEGFVSYAWACPCCRSPYPVQAPSAVTACALLGRLLPGVEAYIEPPARDLWRLAELHLPLASTAQRRSSEDKHRQPGLPPTDRMGHGLQEFIVPGPEGLRCGPCGSQMFPGALARGCLSCKFFACAPCYVRAAVAGLGSFDPEPLRSAQEQREDLEQAGLDASLLKLSACLEGRFDLAPVLHFGNMRRLMLLLPKASSVEVQEEKLRALPPPVRAASRLLRRSHGPVGSLLPLADPYEYYARAALLHAQLMLCSTPKDRDERLHEAREALLVALEDTSGVGSGGVSGAPIGIAARDPRLWYLLGLILCDLGSFAEAKQVYRQVLSHLPMAQFGHVVHFNLALLQVRRSSDEAARAGAARELWEFRRRCRSLRALEDSNSENRRCELCGACCR